MKFRVSIISLLIGAACIAAPAAVADNNLEMVRNLVNKGNYLMAARRFEEALKTYQEAQKYQPTNAIVKENIGKLYNNWGVYLTAQGKYPEAYQKLKKCLEVYPSYRQVQINIGLLERRAEAEGVELEPEAEDPSGGAKKAAKDNYPKLPEGGDLAGKLAPVAPTGPQAGAVLYIGGVKQPVAASEEPSTPMVSPAVSTPALSGGSGDTGVLNSAAPVSGTAPVTGAPTTAPEQPSWAIKNVNPLYPTLPNQFPQTAPPASRSGPAPQIPSSTAPVAPLVPVQPATTGGAPAATFAPPVSLDDQLAAVEMKVYGHKQADLTVLQRLEKIERDAAGQVRTGTIIERIDYLKKSFGL